MKAIIIYASYHHNNTKKLVEYVGKKLNIETKNILMDDIDINEYTHIGLASGIYAFKMHPSILKFINSNDLSNHKVFLLATCGLPLIDYFKDVRKLIPCIGSFICKGYDTFGPFKYIGGIAKKHPDQNDFNHACEFVSEMLKK